MSWRSAYAIENPTGMFGKKYQATQLFTNGVTIGGNAGIYSINLFKFNQLPVGLYSIYIEITDLFIDIESVTTNPFYTNNLSVTDGTTVVKNDIESIPLCSLALTFPYSQLFHDKQYRSLNFLVTNSTKDLIVSYQCTIFSLLGDTITQQINSATCLAIKIS